ncbi:hypothetical protein NT05LI_2749a, partial [Listeria ivanovii FSL F6-596]
SQSAATTAIIRDTRVPAQIRANWSRPSVSLPNQ